MNSDQSFSQYSAHGFVDRHVGTFGTDDTTALLKTMGYESMEQFIADVVPISVYCPNGLTIGDPMSEQDALSELKKLASMNKVYRSFIGQGYYGTITPTVILRNVLENPAWYTAYTPYQAEISQGRLEALLNFQTMICDLTGMDIANASMLDEATAASEAMALARRNVRDQRPCFFIDSACFKQTIDVVSTRAKAAGIEIKIGDVETEFNAEECFGLLVQYPDKTGEIRTFNDTITTARDSKTMVIFAADILSLVLLKSPAELGADVVVGSTQRFGVPMGFGGPHAAYMSTLKKHQRALPGRLVGVSVDSAGEPAYRLALQTREQHIRREKATSNICTAQVLLAVIAAMYACYHGPKGLRAIAQKVNLLARTFSAGLGELGFTVINQHCFDTVTIQTGDNTQAIIDAALSASINIHKMNDTRVSASFDELSTIADVEQLWRFFDSRSNLTFDAVAGNIKENNTDAYYRDDQVLTHPVFSRYQTETDMLRYLRKLSDKDLALDRTMIPLGSCTMKLNAASEMIPVTWPEFSQIHPMAPADQWHGYRLMITQLEEQLAVCTGYDAVSIQPNAGSQGEFAGLLAIDGYHKSRGDSHRNVCLIPQSAHGTNPASAQMCGMRVAVVNCDKNGNIDLHDLRDKAQQHADNLAAIMVTYPSTHGVFEAHIKTVTDIVHRYGGQVYVDGANLNAMVGVASPADLGGDVSHLNLHKTFCIPHGGGGPGVGPVAAKAHLAPFLPTMANKIFESQKAPNAPVISAAPFGSASILPISWMYIQMLGGKGLLKATQHAILNANYVAHRLKGAYSVLYTGEKGLVAHECIIDLRPIKEETGISVEDVAKRLIDYGFHAPTMSFPVSGTLMIEPTESESKQELDRFCDAMLKIREEISRVATGEWPLEDNPLVNSPHTAAASTVDVWEHAYTRTEAVYPLTYLRENKYFPPVGRVDNVFGDKNLACSCPSIENYR